MFLYLMRHGDALPNAPSDDARPLSLQGQEETAQMAVWLKKREPHLKAILTSPLLRALQTAEIVSEVFGPETKVIPTPALTPGNSIHDLLPLLQRVGDIRALCIGHMPDVGHLLSALVWGDPDKGILFRTNATAFIRLPELRFGRGQLEWFVEPGLL